MRGVRLFSCGEGLRMDEMQVTVIEVTVTDKVAQSDGTQYVCDNANNYVIRFVFDDEWSSVPVKTARFKWGNNKHHNEVFEGDTVPVPKLSDIYRFTVGVFAGDLIASTEAVVQCKPSVLGGDISENLICRALIRVRPRMV